MTPQRWSIAATLILATLAPALTATCSWAAIEHAAGPDSSVDAEFPPVIFHDLSGPRVGVTMSPDGTTRSQFGWHQEHQITPASRGPAFVVQSVFVVGGFEQRRFVPNATLVFGARMPGGFEFGIGPSATIGKDEIRTSVVLALGQSFRVGGIRVPVDLALAADRDGQRLSIMTGWAVRDEGGIR